MRVTCRCALAFAILVGSFTLACSNASDTSGAVGTSGEAASSVLIVSSPRGVSIENRAGRPLSNITVSIRPVSGPSFETKLARMDTGEQKTLVLGQFHTSDNVGLNPMFVRPQAIAFTAQDDSGKNYQVTVPWK